MGRYFSARLPPKGRSERGAPVSVLVNRNGGHWKNFPAVGYSDGGSGLPELITRRNPNPKYSQTLLWL